MPEYFDIHSHINFPEFDADRDEVIKRMRENKVWTIAVGAGKKNSEDAVDIANPEKGISACVGLHPDSENENNFDYDYYKKLASNPKVVAIGECGLDYFRIKGGIEETKKKQKEIFIAQIELSLELNKSLMIHCREAYDDIYEILKSYSATKGDKLRGNFHFYVGSVEFAKKILDLGFTMSFPGVITFARDYDEVIKYAPIESIMSETDAPFASPIPFRGKRNEPAYVIEVVKKIAEIRNESFEKVKQTLVSNAFRFFNLSSKL